MATLIITAPLTLTWLWWITFQAELWDALNSLRRKEIRLDDFVYAALTCPLCRGHWLTAPILAWNPIYWTATNGAHIIAEAARNKWLPDIEETE